MHSQAIATVEFADGVTRVVYEDTVGQFVLDDEGEPIYGVWYVPREELEAMFGKRPIIVKAGTKRD
jgi:hypothetical protein